MENNWGDKLDVRYYLAKKLSLLNGKRFLDVACGNGYLLQALNDSNEKYGIDLDQNTVKEALSRNPTAKIIQANLYNLPFKNEFFDVVQMASVIPNADFADDETKRQENQRKAIAEACRVLKKGGTLFLATANNKFYKTTKMAYEEIDSLLKHLFNYTIRGWNPFPKFPFFLPARLLKHVPGWFSFLEWLSEKGFNNTKSKFFFVEAIKK